MKISNAEVEAALRAVREYGESIVQLDALRSALVDALGEAYTVRRARKAAKRERQRKEKDKQVVESVKPTSLFAGMFGQGDEKAFNAAAWGNLEALAGISSAVQGQNELAPSKAPEWDGTFGVGEWETVGGKLAVVTNAEGILLSGSVGEVLHCYWYESGNFRSIRLGRAEPNAAFNLLRPWPRSTEGERL